MTESTKRVLHMAMELHPDDRAILIDELLASLEPADPAIDEAWAREVAERIAAYREGKLRAVPVGDAIRKDAWR
jgi:putative addiction module component (TIGR02574 family)